ncbi:flagellar motor switch protein FliG [Buchnera aphidicola (Hyadaphis tataricae)]|uniref:Flagellar motor switch protein FliG n=1 Tax=Buchnera aphidicola (Hyadaphis tataricae) TaxID=1241859 RepID=A0A4D6XVJ0_9GAMM|nr:flagellar motor switch protein FliG [Buchnera aphidicola]QCI21396.1 flagellar motor switch protein FliG [Buchnera aphidicola (Hyadaphis tataricae)]
MILNGTQKSALLLMSIGSVQAGEILKHLTPFEIQEIVDAMINMQGVPSDVLDKVLLECDNCIIQNNALQKNFNDKYLFDMLSTALGEQKGTSLINEALEVRNAKICIKALNYMNSEQLALLLSSEHAQIITTILIYLDKNQAAQILSYLNAKQRAEIISRITEFHGIEESSLIELNKVINNLLNNKKLLLSEKGGVKTAVSILNSMKIQYERDTIKNISTLNKNIADILLKEMFSFNNIVNLDDEYIKILIKNIEKEKLCVALQKVDFLIKEKFFKNMPDAEAKKLSDILEKNSYISDIAIQNEQKLILIMIKSIVNNGNVSLNNLRENYVE